MLDIYQIFKDLSSVYGPSGREKAIAEKIEAYAAKYADEIHRDKMGNLIVRKNGGGARLMIAAHMDTLGFAATYIDDNGFIRFAPVGGLTVLGVSGCTVRFENGTQGKVWCDQTVKQGDLTLNDYYIDIGADSREQAEQKVKPGDFAVFAGEPHFDGRTIVSPYLDNRIGCAALIAAMEQIGQSANDIYFVFSTQEEVGTRGAAVAAYDIKPEFGIALDVTDTGDVPGVKVPCGTRLGGGPAIKLMDASLIASGKVVAMLEGAAERAKVKIQRDIISSGGMDAGVIQKSAFGVFTGGISIPCRYMHTCAEAVRIDDAYAAAAIIAELARANAE